MSEEITPLTPAQKRRISLLKRVAVQREERRQFIKELLANDSKVNRSYNDLFEYMDTDFLLNDLIPIFNLLHDLSSQDRKDAADILIGSIYTVLIKHIEFAQGDEDEDIDDYPYDPYEDDEVEDGKENW